MEVGTVVVVVCFCTLIGLALATLSDVKRCKLSIKESEREIIESQKEISHTLNEVNTSMKVIQHDYSRNKGEL